MRSLSGNSFPCMVRFLHSCHPSRYQAVNALLAIHKAGVEHNDFAERNIVVSKDKKGCPYVMVVDFGMASDHTCELQLDTIAPYGLAPTNREFLCDELYEVCRIADVWLPSTSYHILLFPLFFLRRMCLS